MMNIQIKYLAVAALMSLSVGSSAQTAATSLPYRDPDLPIPERIHDLIGRMTLEEKVSQMMNRSPAIDHLGIPAYNWWNEGPAWCGPHGGLQGWTCNRLSAGHRHGGYF